MALTVYPGFVNQSGLVEALAAAGIAVATDGTTWEVSDLAKAQSIAASYSPLSYVQRQKVTAAGALLEQKIAAGFTYNGVTVDITGTASIPGSATGNISAMAAIASDTIAGTITTPWPVNFAWVGMGTTATIPLSTPQAMVQFAAAAGHYKSALIQYANQLQAQIEAATTVTAVQAIDITAGWPTG